MTTSQAFVCESSDDIPEGCIAEHQGLSAAHSVALSMGRYSADIEVPLVTACASPLARVNKWDVIDSNLQLFIVKDEVAKTLLETFSEDIEFLPCEVRTSDSRTCERKLLIVKTSYRLIDADRTTVSRIAGADRVMGFKSLVPLDGSARTPAFFRDPLFPPLVFVSPEVAQFVQRHSWNGLRFVPAVGYSR